MTDFELFEHNWNRAVNGLVGRITQENRAVYTRGDINAIWQEELMTHRFSSVGLRDEAQVFLDELFEHRPDTAKKVLDKLRASRLDVGLEWGSAALKGAGAVGAFGVAASLMDSKLDMAARVLGAAVAGGGALLTGSAAVEVGSATKQVIIGEVRKKAQKQLEEYRVLLGD